MEGSELLEGERLAGLLGGQAGQLEAYTQTEFHNFLRTYTVNAASQGEETQPALFYASRVDHMQLQNGSTLYVDWGHFKDYNANVADLVASNFYRLEASLRLAVRAFVADHAPNISKVRGAWIKSLGLNVHVLGSPARAHPLLVALQTHAVTEYSIASGRVAQPGSEPTWPCIDPALPAG
jgi:hypothetical protein